jgi:hypothetical protein
MGALLAGCGHHGNEFAGLATQEDFGPPVGGPTEQAQARADAMATAGFADTLQGGVSEPGLSGLLSSFQPGFVASPLQATAVAAAQANVIAAARQAMISPVANATNATDATCVTRTSTNQIHVDCTDQNGDEVTGDVSYAPDTGHFVADITVHGTVMQTGTTVTLSSSFDADLNITGDPGERTLRGFLLTSSSLSLSAAGQTSNLSIRSGVYYDLVGAPLDTNGEIKAEWKADAAGGGHTFSGDARGKAVFYDDPSSPANDTVELFGEVITSST